MVGLLLLVWPIALFLVRRRLLGRQKGPMTIWVIVAGLMVIVYFLTSHIIMLIPVATSLLLLGWIALSPPIRHWIPTSHNSTNRNAVFDTTIQQDVQSRYGRVIFGLSILCTVAIVGSFLYAQASPPIPEPPSHIQFKITRFGPADNNVTPLPDQEMWCYQAIQKVPGPNNQTRTLSIEGFALYREDASDYYLQVAPIRNPETGEFSKDYLANREKAGCHLRPVRTTNFLAIHGIAVLLLAITGVLSLRTWRNIDQRRHWIWRTIGLLLAIVLGIALYTQVIWLGIIFVGMLLGTLYIYRNTNHRAWIQGV